VPVVDLIAIGNVNPSVFPLAVIGITEGEWAAIPSYPRPPCLTNDAPS